jgi:hypothetical protein
VSVTSATAPIDQAMPKRSARAPARSGGQQGGVHHRGAQPEQRARAEPGPEAADDRDFSQRRALHEHAARNQSLATPAVGERARPELE